VVVCLLIGFVYWARSTVGQYRFKNGPFSELSLCGFKKGQIKAICRTWVSLKMLSQEC